MNRSRLISAAVGIAVAVGQVAAPMLPDHMAPFVGSLRTANYVVTESDLGVPIRFQDLRPDDHYCWRGIVRHGGPQHPGEYGLLDARPIQESVNEANIQHTRLLMSDLVHHANLGYRNRLLPDLSPNSVEVRRFAWLLENGYAGWRSLEWCIEKGRDAAWHWDVLRGARPGTFMNSQGWTSYTASGGLNSKPVLVFPTAEQMGDPEQFSLDLLTASITVNAIGWTSYGASTSPATKAIYVSDTGSDGATGLDDTHPKLTISAGESLMTSGHADWLLLKRGDDWANEQAAFTSTSGYDSDEPMRVGSYGTGNRPRIDCQGISGVDIRSNSAYFSIQDLDLWTSTFVGTAGGNPAISCLFTVTYTLIENCVIDGFGLAIQITNTLPDHNTVRRCVVTNCFDIEDNQQGGGMLIGEVQSEFAAEDNVFHHNGWNETKTVLSTTVASRSGAVIRLAAGSTMDDVYNGIAGVTIAGSTNGPFTVTDYVAATKDLTLSPSPDSATNGSAVAIVGAPKNIFRHNFYVQTDTAGYVGRRNIVSDGGDHGMGRALGQLYHNVVEGNAIQIDAQRTGTPAGTATGRIYQNCLKGSTVDDYSKSGIAGHKLIEVSNLADGTDCKVYDNIGHTINQAHASVSVYGLDLQCAASASLLVDGNDIFDIYDSSYAFGQAVRITGSSTSDITISDNAINQKHTDDKLISLTNGSAFNSLTVSGNSYTGPTENGKFDFLGTNPATYTQWLAFSSETGSTFTTSGAGRTIAGLAEWSNARGGAATRAAAITRLSGFDRASGSWKRIDHDATWVVNYIRGVFGKTLIGYANLPYPMTVGSFQATLGGSDMACSWADPGAPDNPNDIAHYSILKNSVEAGTAVATATSKTIVGGGAGTYQIRVVDWNGVEYALSDAITGPNGLTMTDGATSTTGNFTPPDPTGGAIHVYRKLEGAGSFVLIQTLAADAITFTDTLNT